MTKSCCLKFGVYLVYLSCQAALLSKGYTTQSFQNNCTLKKVFEKNLFLILTLYGLLLKHRLMPLEVNSNLTDQSLRNSHIKLQHIGLNKELDIPLGCVGLLPWVIMSYSSSLVRSAE